jgi:hypothetical protein
MLTPRLKSSPTFRNNNGGLNIRLPAQIIDDGEATIANNCYFNTAGMVQKRGGWALLISAAVPTTNNLIGLFQPAFVSGGVTYRYVVATDGVDVYYSQTAPSATGTWTKITGSLTLAPNANTLVSFVEFNNLLIGFDGVNAPWAWSGTGNIVNLAVTGAAPVGNIGIVYSNYFWVAGNPSNPNRLYYSAAGDPTTWVSTSYIDVPAPSYDDPITGLAILYGDLIIFKRYSIWILRGTDPNSFTLIRNNSSIGCVSPYSVVAVNNFIYFVSDKGLYIVNLSNNKQVCYNVEPRYNTAVANQLQNGTVYRNRIQSLHYRNRNQVWVALDASAVLQDHHDRIMVHDYFNANKAGDPAVSEYTVTGATETAPSIMADYAAVNGSLSPMASFYDQYVYVFSEDSLQDAQGASSLYNISMNWQSKYFGGEDDFSYGSIRFIYTAGLFNGTLSIRVNNSISIGQSASSVTFTPVIVGQFFNQKSTIASSVLNMGRFFQFGFLATGAADVFQLYEYGYDYVDKGRRN